MSDKLRWVETAPQETGKRWILTDGVGTVGQVEQFEDDGPFYGVWANGRTGAVSDLDSCQARVKNGARPS